MTDTVRSTLARYGGAAIAVSMATAARLALHPALGNRQPFVTLVLAVIVTAWYGGLGPSLMALGLGAISGAYFLLAPPASPASLWVADLLGIVLYLVVGTAIVAFGEAGRAARRRLEAEVAERLRAEERLRATLHGIGDAVVATDAGGRVVSLNPVAEALTGWAAGEAAGRPLEEVFHIIQEGSGEPVETPAARVLREGRTVGLANRTALVARDGSQRPIEDSAAPIRDAGGGVSGVVLVFRDVTGRRRAEEALRERERQLRLVTDHAPVLIAHCDPQRRFKFVNRAYAARFGLRPEEVIGRTIPEVLGRGAYKVIEPHVEAVLAGRRVEFEADVPYEGLGTLHMQCAYEPESDGEGRIVGWVAAITDVTGRRRAERALREAEARLAAVVDHSPATVFLKDREGRYLLVNRRFEELARSSGIEGPYLGRTDAELLAQVVAERFRRDDLEVLGSGRAKVYEESAEIGGERYTGLTTKFPLLDEAGVAYAVGGISLDITEYKRAEGRARFQAHLLDAVGQAVIATDPDGRVIYWNRSAEALYGWPAGEAAGRSIGELVVAPESADQAAEILARMRAGEGWSGEFIVRRRDGTTFPAHVTDTPVFDERGSLEAIIGVSSDITERRRAEERLRDSELRFRSLMEQAPFSVQVLDPDGRTLAVNRAWEDLWGLTLDQIADYNMLDDPQLEANGVGPFIRRAFAGEPVRIPAIEYDPNETVPGRTRHADPRRWVSAVAYPLRDAAGRVREVVLVHADITERVRAEEALRRGEERLRLIVESASDYAIFTLDLDGKVASWNSGARNLLGYEEEEIVGRDGKVLFIPEDVERGVPEKEFEKALDRGRAENERWHVRKDGSLFWASGLLMPMRDGGEAVGLLKIMRDTTEQKRTELELEVSRERLDLVVNSSEVGLWYCDLPFDRLVWNAKCKEHFGLPPDAEVTIETFYGRLHPDDREATRRAIERSIEGRSEYDAEFRTVDAEGRVRWIRAIGQPFYDVEGAPIRFDGITVDVTERIRQEEALREADRRKDEFLATLAHELRNPLAPIRNALHLMRGPAADGERFEAERAMAERQVTHLARLVDDLMDVARISKGKIELRTEVLDLADVVRRAVESARTAIDERGHRLDVDLPGEPIRLEADPTRLEQVLWNLLNNAAKYTEPGGEIRLTVESQGGEAAIRVRDTGIGIEPAMLPRVFEMFAQVDHRSARTQGGLGIGLGLVKSLVEMHGGTIEARSAGPGTGSEFVVRLPVVAADAAKSVDGGRADRGPSGADLPRRRILVVDDNADAANSLARLLTRLYGQEVRVAHDGPTALAVAGEFRPEVALLDIGMPGMDGIEVARRLRGMPEAEGALIVALTGWGQESDRERSAQAGFDRHVVKPVEAEVLRGLLADLRPDPDAAAE